MKLLIAIQPTQFTTNIAVMNENGTIIDNVPSNLTNLADNIYNIANKYYVRKVELFGNEDYLKKVRRDIIKSDKYSNFDVEIKGV